MSSYVGSRAAAPTVSPLASHPAGSPASRATAVRNASPISSHVPGQLLTVKHPRAANEEPDEVEDIFFIHGLASHRESRAPREVIRRGESKGREHEFQRQGPLGHQFMNFATHAVSAVTMWPSLLLYTQRCVPKYQATREIPFIAPVHPSKGLDTP